MSTISKRPYNSDQRSAAAATTRARILDHARELFEVHGIDRVTIAEIAASAGVAASSVYGLYKSKEGLLQAMMQAALFGPHFQTAQAAMRGMTDAAVMIAMTPMVSTAIYAAERAELGLIRGASGFSSVLRKLEDEFERLRFEMQEERIRLLFSQGKAKHGLAIEDARRILWMYTSRDVFRMMVHESGWTSEQYLKWLSATLLEALVDRDAWPTQQVAT